jgi:uncharacterized protein with HEPN domain
LRSDSLLLQDIVHAIELIESFTEGMSRGDFFADVRTISAVERHLLTIAEAATRLRDRAEALCPELPWRGIRGMGNWIRHQYERVDPEIVWATVVDDLPVVKAAVSSALRRLDPPAQER